MYMAAAALVARMGRTVALSSDIATRVVYKRWFLEQTYETIAAELEIGTTTAWQIYQRFGPTFFYLWVSGGPSHLGVAGGRAF